jgi:hypothetical protein
MRLHRESTICGGMLLLVPLASGYCCAANTGTQVTQVTISQRGTSLCCGACVWYGHVIMLIEGPSLLFKVTHSFLHNV